MANRWARSAVKAHGGIQRIEFKIYSDGRVEERVFGVKGEECLKVRLRARGRSLGASLLVGAATARPSTSPSSQGCDHRALARNTPPPPLPPTAAATTTAATTATSTTATHHHHHCHPPAPDHGGDQQQAGRGNHLAADGGDGPAGQLPRQRERGVRAEVHGVVRQDEGRRRGGEAAQGGPHFCRASACVRVAHVARASRPVLDGRRTFHRRVRARGPSRPAKPFKARS